jgi:hypothetical protein
VAIITQQAEPVVLIMRCIVTLSLANKRGRVVHNMESLADPRGLPIAKPFLSLCPLSQCPTIEVPESASFSAVGE